MPEQYIHPRYFLVETWADLFRSPGGARQYVKFVQYMINCFRSDAEGRVEDVQEFCRLATAEEGLFLSTTVAQIPELNMLTLVLFSSLFLQSLRQRTDSLSWMQPSWPHKSTHDFVSRSSERSASQECHQVACSSKQGEGNVWEWVGRRWKSYD